MALKVHILLLKKLLSFGHSCKDAYFIQEKLLYCNGIIERMIYFKFYKRRTDYPMDIFVLKEKVVVDQIFELQVYKNSKHLRSKNTIFKCKYSTMMNTKHFCSKHLCYQEHQVLSSGSNSMIANILKTR